MKRIFCALLVFCLSIAALAEEEVKHFGDDIRWGMSAEELQAAYEDSQQLSENMLWLGEALMGKTGGSVFACLENDALYLLSLDYSEDDEAVGEYSAVEVYDDWLAALTERYGEPGEPEIIAAASVMTANSNMTGESLDFDDVLSAMEEVKTWRPSEDTLVMLFVFDEYEICAVMADENVIYPKDENGNVVEFGN